VLSPLTPLLTLFLRPECATAGATAWGPSPCVGHGWRLSQTVGGQWWRILAAVRGKVASGATTAERASRLSRAYAVHNLGFVICLD
jgi:hypothetical protein